MYRFGFDHVVYRKRGYPVDFDSETIAICEAVKSFTMTSPSRVSALVESVRYVAARDIDGAFVECGVWRGGSAMAMMLALQQLSKTDRDFFLYDTFSGMATPGKEDVSWSGESAWKTFRRLKKSEHVSGWCLASLEEVQRNVKSTGYPFERIQFIQGKVQETIPRTAPEKISVLRLDTDWYDSTKHELEHLFPRLQPNGVIILDDYGHWQGARQAVDEYFASHNVQILLNRIDYSGRIGVKNLQ
jgi:O-methyltransferase